MQKDTKKTNTQDNTQQNSIKKSIVSLGTLVIVVGFVFASVFLINTYFQDDLKEKVIVTYNASNKNNSCIDANKPVEITITNNTDKTIEQVTIKMGLYSEGYSKDVSDQKYNKTTTNKAIKPKESYVYCSHAPVKDFAKEVTEEILKQKKYSQLKMGDLVYLSDFSIRTTYKNISFKE